MHRRRHQHAGAAAVGCTPVLDVKLNDFAPLALPHNHHHHQHVAVRAAVAICGGVGGALCCCGRVNVFALTPFATCTPTNQPMLQRLSLSHSLPRSPTPSDRRFALTLMRPNRQTRVARRAFVWSWHARHPGTLVKRCLRACHVMDGINLCFMFYVYTWYILYTRPSTMYFVMAWQVASGCAIL